MDGADGARRRFGPPTRAGVGGWVSANAILVVLLVLILGIAASDPDFISANSVRNGREGLSVGWVMRRSSGGVTGQL